MLTLCKSTGLTAAFLAGVAIAASADPLCCTPTGPCRPPGPQIATLPLANVTLANVTLANVTLANVTLANVALANVAPVLSYYDPYTGPNTQSIQRFRPPCHIPKWHPIRWW
jgi:hypothetical protein